MSLPPWFPPTTSEILRLDTTAQGYAAALSAAVSANVTAYNTAHGVAGVVPFPDYVYLGAITVGLNFWKAPGLWAPSYPFGNPPDVPTVATFTSHVGVGVTSIAIDVATADVVRANAIIAALPSAPELFDVLGCACCTGLALLSGAWSSTQPIPQGPFT